MYIHNTQCFDVACQEFKLNLTKFIFVIQYIQYIFYILSSSFSRAANYS